MVTPEFADILGFQRAQSHINPQAPQNPVQVCDVTWGLTKQRLELLKELRGGVGDYVAKRGLPLAIEVTADKEVVPCHPCCPDGIFRFARLKSIGTGPSGDNIVYLSYDEI